MIPSLPPNGRAQRPASEQREPAGPLKRDVRQPASSVAESRGRLIARASKRHPLRTPLRECRRRCRWGTCTARSGRCCRCKTPCSRSSGRRSIADDRGGVVSRVPGRGTGRVSRGAREGVDVKGSRARRRRRCSRALRGIACPIGRMRQHSASRRTPRCVARSLAALGSGSWSLRHEDCASRPYAACGMLSRVVCRTLAFTCGRASEREPARQVQCVVIRRSQAEQRHVLGGDQIVVGYGPAMPSRSLERVRGAEAH